MVVAPSWDKDQFSYIIGRHGGFESAENYPFNLTSYPDRDPPIPGNPCKRNKTKFLPKSNLFTNATAVPSVNVTSVPTEDMMAAFVHHNGPAQAGINAMVFFGNTSVTDDYFVTRKRCEEVKGQSIDHSITLVGFGTSPKHGDYWIIKNSWTATWHDHGFVYLPRGIDCASITEAGCDLFTVGDPSKYYIEHNSTALQL